MRLRYHVAASFVLAKVVLEQHAVKEQQEGVLWHVGLHYLKLLLGLIEAIRNVREP